MNSQAPDCLLLFTKLPRPGRVKTRLAADLGDEAAAELASLFALDLCAALDQVPAQLVICCAPEEDMNDADVIAAARDWLGTGRQVRVQQGEDLGGRMENALAWALAQGHPRAVLLGSDVPDFPAPLAAKALSDLHHWDAVLCPVLDGGYCLIGFARHAFLPDIFHNMAWSRTDVCAKTLTRLDRAGLATALLPPWHDVDDIKGLNTLYRLNHRTSFNASRTMAALSALHETIAAHDLDLDYPAPCAPGEQP